MTSSDNILCCKRHKETKPKFICIHDLWYVQCRKCQLEGKSNPYDICGLTKKSAIDQWNAKNIPKVNKENWRKYLED